MSTTILVAAMMATLASAPDTVADTDEKITQSREEAVTTVVQRPTVSAPRNQIITITEPESAPVIITETVEVTGTVNNSEDIIEVTEQETIDHTPGTIPGVSLELEQRFDRLSQCESTGDWSINTGNGYYGGLQFSPTTWDAFGGERYAPDAHLATREQQIEIAAKVLEGQGWGAWPACTASFGWR